MTTDAPAQDGPAAQDLEGFLSSTLTGDQGSSLASTLLALAAAASAISALLARGPLAGQLGAKTAKAGEGGDQQKTLDVLSNAEIVAALATTRTAYFASEEEDAILTLDAKGLFAVAVDPLDGSSNIDIDASVGTIFSIFPASTDGGAASFYRPGREQVAAGYFVYGPHTDLVFTTGDGVHHFVMDPDTRRFQWSRSGLAIPPSAPEFAVNASNYRHWFEPVRSFFDECLQGAEGARGVDFNMRWPAALVVDAHRILTRGGIYVYPADRRPGYEKGRLRLIYEAFPIAWIAEQAGGRATDGQGRILDLVASDLHERTPLVFGSSGEVAVVAAHYNHPEDQAGQAPLFGRRGLFRD